MPKTSKFLLPAVIIVLLALVAAFFLFQGESEDDRQASIESFEECAAAGNPVMESYPRQCRTSDGRLFVEEISEPVPTPFDPPPGKPEEAVCVDSCGDGMCAEVVCLAVGCPCAETPQSCPQDCPAE